MLTFCIIDKWLLEGSSSKIRAMIVILEFDELPASACLKLSSVKFELYSNSFNDILSWEVAKFKVTRAWQPPAVQTGCFKAAVLVGSFESQK